MSGNRYEIREPEGCFASSSLLSTLLMFQLLSRSVQDRATVTVPRGGPRERRKFQRIEIDFLTGLQVADHKTRSVTAVVASYLDHGEFADKSDCHLLVGAVSGSATVIVEGCLNLVTISMEGVSVN